MFDQNNKPTVRAVIAFLACMTLAGCGAPEPVKPPASLIDFTSPDKSFAGKGPSDWKKEESGVQGGMQSSVVFEKGTAQVSFTADLQGSLMADISRANNAQVDNVAGMLPEGMQSSLPRQIPPVEKLHVAAKSANEKRYNDYDEKPMQELRSQLGEGRISEFTGEKSSGLLKYKVHGYRITVLSGDRRLTGVCRCAETDWKALSPTFGKIAASLAAGPG